MSLFRNYLREHNEGPDLRLRERDESWFAFELLLIRLGFLTRDWPPDSLRSFRRFPWLLFPDIPIVSRLVPDPLRGLRIGTEAEQAFRFVAFFLCFFVLKPPSYKEDILAFKQFFIPDFSTKVRKQQLLFKSALPSFSRTPLESAMPKWRWESLSEFFRPVHKPRREPRF